MFMVNTSWANLIINYDLTNILIKLMGCILCYILHILNTLRHDRVYFQVLMTNPAKYLLIFHGYCLT